jgi:hypothetical protein
MFKTEATLGLVGAILGIISCLLVIIVVLVVGIFLNAAATAFDESMAEFDEAFGEFEDYDMEVSTAVSQGAGAAVGIVIVGLVLSIASVVCGFIGSAKLRKDNKSGGILLIVAGGLSLISLFTAGFWGIATMVLFLIGGIMALAKKAPVAAA